MSVPAYRRNDIWRLHDAFLHSSQDVSSDVRELSERRDSIRNPFHAQLPQVRGQLKNTSFSMSSVTAQSAQP